MAVNVNTLRIVLPVVTVVILAAIVLLWCRKRYNDGKREQQQYNLDREALEAQERETRRAGAAVQRAAETAEETDADLPRPQPAILRRPSHRPPLHRPSQVSDILVSLSFSRYPSVILSPPPAAPFGQPDYDSWFPDDKRADGRSTLDVAKFLNVPPGSPSRRDSSRIRDSFATADYTDVTVSPDRASDGSEHDPQLMPSPLIIRKQSPLRLNDSPNANLRGAADTTPTHLDTRGPAGQSRDRGGDFSHGSAMAAGEGFGIRTPVHDNETSNMWGSSLRRQGSSRSGNKGHWEDIPLQENVHHANPPRGLAPSYTAPDFHGQESDAEDMPKSATNPNLQSESEELRRRLLLTPKPSEAGDANQGRGLTRSTSQSTIRPGPSSATHRPQKNPRPTSTDNQDGFPMTPTEESLRELMALTNRLAEIHEKEHQRYRRLTNVASCRDDMGTATGNVSTGRYAEDEDEAGYPWWKGKEREV